MEIQIYRYNPDVDSKPIMQSFMLPDEDVNPEMKLRSLLLLLKERFDPTIAFRHSCGEGVCGSDAMNINGLNGLSCITRVGDLGKKITLRPVPGLPVIRDLIVDMEPFFDQYKAVKPWIVHHGPPPEADKEYPQTPQERKKLDGLYECILCGCCSTQCPSFWWNPDKFHGPAALLQAYRFIADSRDDATEERLAALDDSYKLFRCHSIQNCVQVCPKGLNPTAAIDSIKLEMSKRKLSKIFEIKPAAAS